MTPSEALEQIVREQEQIVKSETEFLYLDLKIISPIGETGNFRRSWTKYKKSRLSWKIHNSANYASILARGRRFVNGRYEGSIQWQHGLSPMLQKTSKNIERRNNAIQY